MLQAFLIAFGALWFFFGPVIAVIGVLAIFLAVYIYGSTLPDDDPRIVIGPKSRRRSAKPQTSTRQPPEQYIARWSVRYRDRSGEITKRVVRVTLVRPVAEELHVWCELRQDVRTFLFSGLHEVVDMETGELVDMRSWLAAYKLSRRKKAPASTRT